MSLEGPLVPHYAVGFRAWQLRGDYLHSLTQQTAWTGVDQKAVCLLNKNHQAPVEGCSCGLYAHHELEVLRDYCDYFRADHTFFLVGAVAMRGRLQIHHHGVRAEHMRLLTLSLLDKHRPVTVDALAHHAAKKLGVPMVELEMLEEIAAAYGSPVDPALRPAAPARPSVSGAARQEELRQGAIEHGLMAAGALSAGVAILLGRRRGHPAARGLAAGIELGIGVHQSLMAAAYLGERAAHRSRMRQAGRSDRLGKSRRVP